MIQHPRQTPREHLWIHHCSPRCFLCLSLPCHPERKIRRFRSAAQVFPRREEARFRRHLHCQHVSCRGSYPLLGTRLEAWMFVDVALRQVGVWGDLPDQVPELISQRRRWLNGSFFATIHSISPFITSIRVAYGHAQVLDSRGDDIPISLSHIFMVLFGTFLSFLISWISLIQIQAHYYIAFSIISHALEDRALVSKTPTSPTSSSTTSTSACSPCASSSPSATVRRAQIRAIPSLSSASV